MKSCWIVTKDHQNTLEYRDVPQPQPKAGEIVIKVMASALNRGEMFVGGVVHGGPEKLGGNEASGTVHAIGDGVTGVKVGDAVFGRVRGGFRRGHALDVGRLIKRLMARGQHHHDNQKEGDQRHKRNIDEAKNVEVINIAWHSIETRRGR